MVYEIKKLIDYILNNNLNIDKSLFFTIVIGQISIYGILLTFYQFVASFQGNRKAAVTYLGTSLNEYFVKQTVSSFHKIVSKKWFATVYKGNIIKNLIMDCQSYTKYRPNETTGGIFVSWRRKEELPTGA